MSDTHHIKSYIHIKNNTVSLNGKTVYSDIEPEFKSFIKAAYKATDTKYPKFFKMDNLSKLAFLASDILLVNEDSMSRSEFTAMAFQTADNVITVGNQTAGADGDVVVFEYLGGFRTAISGNGIEYPNGSESQRKGVKIDIEVKPTIKGLKKGRDEILEKAIELASE